MADAAEVRPADRERAPAPALAGRLSAVSLFDLCQFLMLNRKTGNLTVRSGAAAAYLVFLDGQLLSAADENRTDGERVVLRAVQWNEGTFEFAPGPVPLDRRIQASTENILLEAARRIDEMEADEGARGGIAGGAESAFREKQARGASIVEAFRSAVADGESARSGLGWKAVALARLTRPSGERLLLGPGARVAVVGGRGCEEIPGVSVQEVESWMEDLAPPLQRPEGRGGIGIPRPATQIDGTVLWAVRVQSPGGDWVAASAVRPCLPEWSELGLPEADFTELERRESGLCLVLGGRAHGDTGPPGREGLAAWLHRRAAQRQECGIVIEDLPRYDWSSLAGDWRGFPAAWVRRGRRMESLVRTSGARTVVWIGSCSAGVLAESLQLASAGVMVVLAEEAMDLATWVRRAERRLESEMRPWIASEGNRGIAWQLGCGDSPSGLPLRSEILPISAPRAAA